ncbi:MAG: hypothetical protein AWM53_00859 [Candidatus Dichloromethanomonas elyunquensis]|nr:MAG: hypothetical protein AWM53_00859 [Candidatus Dichloromethanomonas elyunquensis]
MQKAKTEAKREEDQVRKKKENISAIMLFILYGLTSLLIVLVLLENWKAR